MAGLDNERLQQRSPSPSRKLQDGPTDSGRTAQAGVGGGGKKSPMETLADRLAAAPNSDRKAIASAVSIAGVPLRLKSSHDDQTVNELVSLVDRKVREALPLTKTGSIQNAAILAALHMAEELVMLKRRTRDLIDEVEDRTRRVIEDLEQSSPKQG
jgi:cell division protein ZapA